MGDLGQMYDTGADGLKEDPAQATIWYRKAAETGDAEAESSLARRYEMGVGVARDDAEALIWARKAAAQGEMSAQMDLASRYEDGRGVPRDDAEAFRWNLLLADQDFVGAQRKVGAAYALGQGVAQDYVQAYRWLDTALTAERDMGRDTSDAEAIALDGVAAHLTASQLDEAKTLAASWKGAAHDRLAARAEARAGKASPVEH